MGADENLAIKEKEKVYKFFDDIEYIQMDLSTLEEVEEFAQEMFGDLGEITIDGCYVKVTPYDYIGFQKYKNRINAIRESNDLPDMNLIPKNAGMV